MTAGSWLGAQAGRGHGRRQQVCALSFSCLNCSLLLVPMPWRVVFLQVSWHSTYLFLNPYFLSPQGCQIRQEQLWMPSLAASLFWEAVWT